MGGVQIAPNMKKTSQRIDPNGNIIDPKTKQVLIPVEQDYVPSVQVAQPKEARIIDVYKEATKDSEQKSNPLKEAIKAEVQKAVQEQIKSIDIVGMVAEAMKEAFK